MRDLTVIQLFDERPVWMRHSILAQFSEDDIRVITAFVTPFPSLQRKLMRTGGRYISQASVIPSVPAHSGSA